MQRANRSGARRMLILGEDELANRQVTVKENGETTFQPDPNGRDRFLTLNPEQIAGIREVLAALTSEPPHN